MSAIDLTDEELLAYLELPEEDRAGNADEFLDKATRRLELHRNRLARHADRLLVRHGLAGHGDDVASETILEAWISLKRQISLEIVAYEWLRPMPLYAWLLLIHGAPFKGNQSGVITNYIRRHKRRLHPSLSQLGACPSNRIFLDEDRAS